MTGGWGRSYRSTASTTELPVLPGHGPSDTKGHRILAGARGLTSPLLPSPCAGTIDALLCCREGCDNVNRMCVELARVLQPGAVFLAVTLGSPQHRLPLLCRQEFGWSVSVCLLPRLPEDQMVSVPNRYECRMTKKVKAQGNPVHGWPSCAPSAATCL